MSRGLSQEQVGRYQQDGILFPLDVMSAQEAAGMLQQLEANEAAHGGRLSGRIGQKPHLLYPWMDQLVRHPAILDAVEAVLGPNLFCWGSQFFAKNARDPGYVSWHQDGTYWGLSSPDVMTAWVALTPSVPQNGCMRVIPGTHKQQVPHEDRFAATNLLSRGQEIAVDVDISQAVDVALQPGQMSLHHVLIFHGSEPNGSDVRRVGFAIRYVPTHVSQKSGIRESALLVRGQDEFGNFDHETSPEAEMHPDAVARHKQVIDRQMQILYAGAKQKGRREVA
ncbi:MAG: phytanoyl-CoA dioxygenase family protein [Lautropia sp.]|nr:phytanoyl-CoA dioxygenase family protein [Lautropia sp.]